MFGFISKKKVIKAIEHIVNEYDDVNNAPKGFGKINYYYYACGNMNAANYIAKKVGIDTEVYVKR
jgi:hypothetical protein